jgi:hypothetical protein
LFLFFPHSSPLPLASSSSSSYVLHTFSQL